MTHAETQRHGAYDAIPKGLNHSAQGCGAAATLGTGADPTLYNSERVSSVSAPTPFSIYDSAAVDRLRAALKFEPRRLRALRTALCKKYLGVQAALAELPANVRDEF